MDNKIELLLHQILENQSTIQSELTSRLDKIDSKLNAVYNQTADLTEFRTGTSDKLEAISKDIKFIKHKIHETEEDVFDIKDHLKIIK